MDTLRIPKGGSGGGSSSTTNSRQSASDSGGIPLAIRFNADEESVEEIMAVGAGAALVHPETSGGGSNSLSTSPQFSPADDFNWRKELLQSSFFHRKRSGSIEGGTSSSGGGGGLSPSSNLISNLTSNTADTVGTWKLIKGKVSQAMEDIKSKNVSSPVTSSVQLNKSVIGINNGDSDNETPTRNSSISEDLSLELSNPASQTLQTKFPLKIQLPPSHLSDSDSDIDADILDTESIPAQLPSAATTSPSIRRPFASLRSKALNTAATVAAAKKQSKVRATADDSPIRSGFLRKRRKDNAESAASRSTTATTFKSKKDVEIESGVEMLEDMILPAVNGAAGTEASLQGLDTGGRNETVDTNNLLFTHRGGDGDGVKFTPSPLTSSHLSLAPDISKNSGVDVASPSTTLSQMLKHCLTETATSRSVAIMLVLVALLLFSSIPDFFRGIIACLLAMSLFSVIGEMLTAFAKQSHQLFGIGNNGPERTAFQIPDYSKLPICEIPAAEEHKSLKSYAGWMCEINSYDPGNFHISMTRPVYVRLDGCMLRISNTSTRISRRSMWNEAPIHRKNVTFTRNRYFNLLGCRIEMCPRGLARKRYFSRKYPIQLIIKTVATDPANRSSSMTENPLATSPSQTTIAASMTDGQQQQCTAAGNDSNTISDFPPILHQNSNDSSEDKTEFQMDFDFSTAILHADLQKLQESNDSIATSKETGTVPCGDETRLLLFARCDREKEDWYRRFEAASIGQINDQELRIPDIVMMTDEEVAAAVKAVPIVPNEEPTHAAASCEEVTAGGAAASDGKRNSKSDSIEDSSGGGASLFEGLLMTTDAARNPHEYVRFMSRYQKACSTRDLKIPVIENSKHLKRNRRQRTKEDELWKGIDQNLYLGPSGSVVWANVLIGRVLYSCLNDQILLEKIQEFLQRKLSAIKLPSFMEDVIIAQTYLGETPPLIHRISQPMLDERGTWIDADVTYEGLMHMTITTKLNLLRLKRQQQQQFQQDLGSQTAGTNATSGANNSSLSMATGPSGDSLADIGRPTIGLTIGSSSGAGESILDGHSSAIYDSNAESSGASSSDSENPTMCTIDSNESPTGTSPQQQQQTFYNTPGSSRRLLRIVDRITASNLFQTATEISYIQRAMENMSTKITLRVELKGLVARVAINLPPPPSDRVWIGFRGPPRLWISAKPAVGDHTFDWSIVTNVIESKLCEEVYKYLVYPNMVDIIAPFLGQSTYKE